MRWIWFVLVVLAGGLTGYLFTRFEGSAPRIETRSSPIFVGTEHTHEFRIMDEGTGVEAVRVWLESGDRVHELAARHYAGSLFTGAELDAPRQVQVTFRPGDLGLADGRAVLRAEARDYSWAGNTTRIAIPVVIDTRPPRIELRTGLTYVRLGGAEAVVYRVDEEQVQHGVEVGKLRFPGFPHPADPSLALAFYALPPGAGAGAESVPRVVATDRAGNRAVAAIPISIIERSLPRDVITLSEGFMERKVNELLGSRPGGLLDAYLQINRRMRAENAAKLLELCRRSSPERLWAGPFHALPHSHVGARFAEQRSYRYQGREVDRQTHMGYDLASTAHAAVPAANDGVVVYADRLGIYGNTVVVDHGLGLFSLYGHLSELAVRKAQAVSAGERLGSTGSTGLAGGDHLHFAMLVSGVFVDPLEWIDPRWIREHIQPKLAPGRAGTS